MWPFHKGKQWHISYKLKKKKKEKKKEKTKTGLNKEWIIVLSLLFFYFYFKPSNNFKSIVQDIVIGRNEFV